MVDIVVVPLEVDLVVDMVAVQWVVGPLEVDLVVDPLEVVP